MEEFFAMGGYAGFIWPAYGVTVIVLIAVLVGTWQGLKRRRRQLEALQAARGSRRGRRAAPTAGKAAASDESDEPDDSAVPDDRGAAAGSGDAKSPLTMEQGRDA